MDVSIVSLLEEHLQADVKNFLQEVHENCSDHYEIIHCDSEKRDSDFSSKEQGFHRQTKTHFLNYLCKCFSHPCQTWNKTKCSLQKMKTCFSQSFNLTK